MNILCCFLLSVTANAWISLINTYKSFALFQNFHINILLRCLCVFWDDHMKQWVCRQCHGMSTICGVLLLGFSV